MPGHLLRQTHTKLSPFVLTGLHTMPASNRLYNLRLSRGAIAFCSEVNKMLFPTSKIDCQARSAPWP